ncbi:MAG: glycosyltransferase family 2 protein [Eubacteriales bacterium]|nr:glycosyltransferase family 2 protein [Eubacteriales bacterium]
MSESLAYIILNYKTWEDTIAEINNIIDVFKAKPSQIIVVDNCSPNESAIKLEEYANATNIIFLKSNTNRGYAAGNNIGLRYAWNEGFKYAWILNNDVVIEDSQLKEKMISVFEKDHSVAIVNPDIYLPGGHMCNRESFRPNLWDLTFGLIGYKKKGRAVKDLGGYGYVYRPQGCCMMVDLKKLHEVDYMDEKTFLYSEEPILAERLIKKNYRCALCIGVSILHNHSVTVASSIEKRKVRAIMQDSFRYYLKEYRGYRGISLWIALLFNRIKWILLG